MWFYMVSIRFFMVPYDFDIDLSMIFNLSLHVILKVGISVTTHAGMYMTKNVAEI